MIKIPTDELWDNFSFVIRDDRTGKINSVKIKDFFEKNRSSKRRGRRRWKK